MKFQIIGLICLIIGFIIIYVDQYYRYKYNQLPKEKIEYRYLPRTAKEQLDEPVFPSDIFETMFSQPDPWILTLNDLDTRKQDNINQYFISAL
jgi:hypothetical protein